MTDMLTRYLYRSYPNLRAQVTFSLLSRENETFTLLISKAEVHAALLRVGLVNINSTVEMYS